MEIIKKNNMVSINGKMTFFDENVDTVITFSDYYIVLLMNDNVPDNNVEAVDYIGNRVWNISQIIQLPYSEAYISLTKESEVLFSVVSYSGVKFVVDITTLKIVRQNITK